MNKHLAILLVLYFAGSQVSIPAAVAQNVTLRGFITDGSTGQPLQGATVLLERDADLKYGAVSNADGIYQIAGIVADRYVFTVRFLGFAPLQDTLILGDEPFSIRSVALNPREEALDEVIIEVESGAARVEAGLQTIRPTDLQRIPTPDVSGDLASYLQSLPGIVSVGDRGGQLFIRGGTPSQNMVLMDGLLVFQPFHIIGFFSAFPEDIVSHVDLYAGGFGARYTGRISSVIDVKTRDGNVHNKQSAWSLSPFLAGIQLEGPLTRGSSGFLLSVRKSVIEETGPLFAGKDLPYQFGDVFLKLHNVEGDKARCSLTSMYTYDRGNIDSDGPNQDVFRWNNAVVGGRCVSLPAAAPVLFELVGGFSRVHNEVGDIVNPERSSKAVRANTEIHLTRFFGRVALSWGLNVHMNWLTYRLGEQFGNVENNKDVLFGFGGYVEVKYKLSEHLHITPGIGLNTYASDYPASLDPRLRLLWRPDGEDGKTEFSTAIGRYTQTVTGVMDERDAGSAFIAWLPAPIDNAQSQAFHGILGWQQKLGAHVQFAAEGFIKRFRNLPIPIWSTIAQFTTTLELAKGRANGFDTRLEYQRKSFYGYVSYGYSRTEYESSQEQFAIWYDTPVQRYHPPHDRRHQLNVVASVNLGRFKASARWQYGSGLPFTRPLGFDELIPLRDVVDVRRVYGTTRVLYDRPYEGRLPGYHRLDLSIDRPFSTRIGTLTAQLGAINVYDRANLFYFDVFTVRRVNQLPVLPIISLKLETD